MKRPDRPIPNRDEAIEATAAAWLAERDDGLTPEAAAEFTRWRQADPRHEAAVVLLEGTWGRLQQLQSFRPQARIHPDHDLLARPAGRAGISWPAWAGSLALAAALALVAAWWWLRPGRPSSAAAPVPAVLATVANGYVSNPLPDGSIIELNASSEVRINYTPAERRIRLLRGEAHFTVAKNKARPFWVEAGSVAVRAVGTEFDVCLRSSDVQVLVTEGRVQVDRTTAPAFGATAPRLKLLAELGVDQQELFSLQNIATPPALVNLPPAVIRAELEWQGPRLQFVDTPLAEVVRQFNRYNQVQLELGDPVLGSRPVGGSFKAENVEAFVRLLENGRDVVADREDENHIILRRAP